MKYSSPDKAGFTLVELMVSTAIIGLIMLVLVGMTNQTSATWRNATEKIEKFQEARDGFEAMTRRLSMATLNTNWDYLDKNGLPRDTNPANTTFKNFVPMYYGRISALRFMSGPMSWLDTSTGPITRPGHGVFFQAPFGVLASEISTPDGSYQSLTGLYNGAERSMDNLLNTWGYFVEVSNDLTRPAFIDPAKVPNRWRPRLMEYMQPAEKMALYDRNDATFKWFTGMLPPTTPDRPVRVLAENILTLVILPKLSKADEDLVTSKVNATAAMLAPQYRYNSFWTDSAGAPLQPPLNPGQQEITFPGLQGMNNPKNQLPPILMVTMVALDERSAGRLADKYSSDNLMGIGALNTLFTKAPDLDTDVAALERILVHEKLTYRVFTTNLTIRGAKWSRVQTK